MSAEWRVLSALGGIAFVVVVLFHPGQLYIDTRPDLYLDPGKLLRESLSTWVPGTGLGTSNYDTGYLPVAALFALMHEAHVPTWLMMRLWRLALLVVAALGARRLYADLLPSHGAGRHGAAGRVAAAVFYAANPYVVAGAATTPVMLPYALLPWLLLALRHCWPRPGATSAGRPARFRRWWAGVGAFGLVFLLMGGFNAGVVPIFMLLAVPLVAWDAVRRQRVPLRHVLRGTAAAALACVAVSAYWIAATLSALGTANAVAGATEDPTAIATVSSYAEVLRGLGGWLMYGSDALGPFRPGFTSFLDNPVTILATFTLAACAMLGAWLSRHRLRRLGLGLAVVGLVLMSGGHPPSHPAPFGRALLWGFEHLPQLIAFRTTNKAGALAMLGLTLLAALGADALWPRLRGARRAWVAGLTAFGVVMSVTPVWLGLLFPGQLSVPVYWRVAAQDLTDRGGGGRVLALPGETNALYRWRPRGVDDFAPELVDRPVVVARSFPDGPLGAWNSLTSVVAAVAEPTVPPRLLSTYADYLGASDVLVRNDMYWELMGAPRPAQQVAVAEADPGLDASALYGRPGQTVTPLDPLQPVDAAESRLPPLLRYHVREPVGVLRLFPERGQLLVAGDNAALPSAVWAGLLDGDRPFRLLPQVSDSELTRALASGARLVLTDTNRRHASNDHRFGIAGPLLSAQGTSEDLRAIGTPSQQTVATYTGIAEVSATASGSVFGPTPDGRPFLALDGDRETAWRFGDFGTAVGKALTVTLDAPRSLSTVTLVRPGRSGGGVAIGTVTVTAGDQRVTGSFGDRNRLEVTLPHPVTAASLTVHVDEVDGAGGNQVGLSELRIPGVTASESTRLPDDLARRAAEDADLARVLAGTPVDVLLTRSTAEHESDLERVFDLPTAQDFRLRAELTGEPRKRWSRCRPLLTVDDRPVDFRLAHVVGQGVRRALELRSCGTVTVPAGSHDLRVDPRHLVRRVHLASTRGTPAAARLDAPEWSGTATSYTVQVPAATEDRLLVLAEGLDDRWRASLDGHDLGEPIEVNGFAMGWRVPAGESGTLRIVFGPQRGYELALGGSGVSVLVCLLLVAGGPSLRRLRRRSRA